MLGHEQISEALTALGDCPRCRQPDAFEVSVASGHGRCVICDYQWSVAWSQSIMSHPDDLVSSLGVESLADVTEHLPADLAAHLSLRVLPDILWPDFHWPDFPHRQLVVGLEGMELMLEFPFVAQDLIDAVVAMNNESLRREAKLSIVFT
ncbi:hypothetical protein [Citricoccus alkalitolerans]|uniref:Uncharacterized protein n=1 Tax=Citricoccus alkalitolerans TaxID=246603 RepID=A0ABV8XX66_9MICC